MDSLVLRRSAQRMWARCRSTSTNNWKRIVGLDWMLDENRKTMQNATMNVCCRRIRILAKVNCWANSIWAARLCWYLRHHWISSKGVHDNVGYKKSYLSTISFVDSRLNKVKPLKWANRWDVFSRNQKSHNIRRNWKRKRECHLYLCAHVSKNTKVLHTHRVHILL